MTTCSATVASCCPTLSSLLIRSFRVSLRSCAFWLFSSLEMTGSGCCTRPNCARLMCCLRLNCLPSPTRLIRSFIESPSMTATRFGIQSIGKSAIAYHPQGASWYRYRSIRLTLICCLWGFGNCCFANCILCFLNWIPCLSPISMTLSTSNPITTLRRFCLKSKAPSYALIPYLQSSISWNCSGPPQGLNSHSVTHCMTQSPFPNFASSGSFHFILSPHSYWSAALLPFLKHRLVSFHWLAWSHLFLVSQFSHLPMSWFF